MSAIAFVYGGKETNHLYPWLPIRVAQCQTKTLANSRPEAPNLASCTGWTNIWAPLKPGIAHQTGRSMRWFWPGTVNAEAPPYQSEGDSGGSLDNPKIADSQARKRTTRGSCKSPKYPNRLEVTYFRGCAPHSGKPEKWLAQAITKVRAPRI